MDDYQGEGGGELVHYFEAPLRRPLAILIPLVIAVVVSIIVGRMMPKIYRATTVILVEGGEKVPDGLAKRVNPGGNLQTLKEEVLSRTRLEQVIRELDPNVKEDRLVSMVDKMRRGTKIGVKGNDLFTLEFDDLDPKRAMEVTNKMAAVFIENAGQVRAAKVAETYEFIVSNLEEARKALEAHETAVVQFKTRNMGHLPEQTGANLATLQRLQAEKQSVEANLRAAQEKVEQLEKNPPTAAGPGGELAGLRSKLAELRLRYTDEYPDVQTLKIRIQHLEEIAANRGGPSPEERTEASLTAARELIEKFKAKSENLEEKIAGVQARVDGAPRLEQELTSLNRDYAKLQSNYQAMLNKKMDADMAGKLEEHWKGGQFRILDPAVLPQIPISPNKKLFVLIGILVGLVLGVVVALGLEVIDPSIKSVSDLENLVPFPVLATLPRVKAAKRAASPARKRAQSA